MKKQFQFLAATFITVAIISCSKEKVEMTETPSTINEEIATSSSSNRPYVDPLTISLEGRFEFNSNLKDVTKKLADGVSSKRLASYGTDRKGIAKAALYLDGAYSVKLKNVPQQTNTSLSVWVKPSDLSLGGGIATTNLWLGPHLGQSGASLSCAVGVPGNTPGEYVNIYNTNWHHVVIAFNGSYITVYINNVLKTSIPYTASIPPSLVDYFVGWSSVTKFWKGYVDDLRLYSRTLSATDVQKLYNQ